MMFNFAHLNPGSLPANFDELKLIVKEAPLHAIAISETWFKTRHSNKLYEIEGYKLFRKDRAKRRGGGVCVYIKTFLNPKLICCNATNSLTDVLFIEISNSLNMKLAIGVVYNPLKIHGVNDFEHIVGDLSGRYSDIILMGDFNINCLLDEPSVNDFIDHMLSYGYHLISKDPTNFVNDSATLIDLAFTKEPSSIKMFSQISVPGIATTHDMIYGSYKFPTNVTEQKQYKYIRDFNSVDRIALMLYANSLQWSQLYTISDVNEQLLLFNNFINNILNTHVPLKKIRIKNNILDKTFNPEIQKQRNIRDYLHEKWRKNKSEMNWKEYTTARNRVNSMVKANKCKFFKKNFNLKQPSKMFWRKYKTFVSPSVYEDKADVTPEEFSDYFSSVFSVPDSNCNLNSLNFNCSENKLFFKCVSPEEVSIIINSISSNAVGVDEFSQKFIKMLLPIILGPLTHILNCCITKSIFPDSWKIAKIIPIPKSATPRSAIDFRPISILPTLSKVLERIIKSQIVNYLTDNILLNKFQSGFRFKHSTLTALLKVTDDLSSNIEEGNVSVLTLLDFSKAFDKVNHAILLRKLASEFSFSKTACQLIQSYLTDRYQIVTYYGSASEAINITSGVPQGSILGPILFSLYINDICSSLDQADGVQYHLFADDLQIYASAAPDLVTHLFDKLNNALQIIFNWSVLNQIEVNPSKSQAILVSKTNRVRVINDNYLSINQQKIEFSDTVKSLGLTIDCNLNWCGHINKLCARIYGFLSQLWLTAKYIPFDAKLHFIRSLVGPSFLYCSPIYAECSKQSKKKLKVALNACARYIFNKRIGESISMYAKQIFNCSLDQYFEYNSSITMFKIVKSKTPAYLYERLSFSKSKRTLNLNLPVSCKCEARKRSFFVHGVKLWNSLEMELKNAVTTNTFKKLYFKNIKDT